MPDINMIQIHELNEASSVAATDVLAIDTGDATLKLKASKLTTGVKGNAESSYRTGNVNLTPANIGAVSTSEVIQKALYNTDTTGITAYPTEPGLRRTTGTLPAGMPTGANAYGVLLICGAGGYYMHIYADAVGGVYIAEKPSTGAPATWRKVTTTNVAPIS